MLLGLIGITAINFEAINFLRCKIAILNTDQQFSQYDKNPMRAKAYRLSVDLKSKCKNTDRPFSQLRGNMVTTIPQ
jgi:hypothetical protein